MTCNRNRLVSGISAAVTSTPLSRRFAMNATMRARRSSLAMSNTAPARFHELVGMILRQRQSATLRHLGRNLLGAALVTLGSLLNFAGLRHPRGPPNYAASYPAQTGHPLIVLMPHCSFRIAAIRRCHSNLSALTTGTDQPDFRSINGITEGSPL
jgi:hypothetical protein